MGITAGHDRHGKGPQAGSRPRELQDSLNFYIFHPLARRLALRLAPTPITPNMVSVAGGLLVVAAAIAYARPGWPLPALIGMLLHLSWHVVDGADGDLARLTGRSSPRGELVDGICDYASHIVLYLTLGWILQEQIGPIAWLLTVASGVSRIVQANHFEVQRRQYQWWVHGVAWMRSNRKEGAAVDGDVAMFGAAYLKLSHKLAPNAPAIDAQVAAAQGDPRQLERIRAAIRRHSAPMLAGLSLLSANYRTVVLGLSMLAGSPIYFFIFEAAALNLLLVRSIRQCDAAIRRMIADIDQADASTRR